MIFSLIHIQKENMSRRNSGKSWKRTRVDGVENLLPYTYTTLYDISGRKVRQPRGYDVTARGAKGSSFCRFLNIVVSWGKGASSDYINRVSYIKNKVHAAGVRCRSPRIPNSLPVVRLCYYLFNTLPPNRYVQQNIQICSTIPTKSRSRWQEIKKARTWNFSFLFLFHKESFVFIRKKACKVKSCPSFSHYFPSLQSHIYK